MNNFVKSDKQLLDIYGKQDIMKIFKCESDKALRILKVMFQMDEAIKIGKEYYVDKKDLINFIERYKGKEVCI